MDEITLNFGTDLLIKISKVPFRWTSCSSQKTTKIQGFISIDIRGSVCLQ